MLTIDQLTKKIKKNSKVVDLKKVEEAYNFAAKYHKEQLRKSGVPYVQHPLSVAYQLADFKFDTATFIAALLHDVIEDTKATPKVVNEKFGREVLKLVLGVTKLSRLQLGEKAKEYTIENLRKMFLAMAQDIRVVIIKLADRHHNLKTLKYLDSKKKIQKARETMEVYAPLANRLGMGELKGELEDLAFLHLHPEEYKWIKNIVEEEIERRQEYIKKIKDDLESKLNKNNIKYTDIHGRAKGYYSLYKKLKKHDDNINKIYDLTALRVIVKNISDCYKTLGLIHQNWKPLLGRIKDYISIPKSNGYQSLHTTILYPPNTTIEIQIRTPQMHFEAEYGVAAAWHYSETKKPTTGAVVPKKLSWINELIKWQDELKDNKKFAEVLKIDFFKDRIFVFTPKGEVFDLPEGSTPVDFAYHIHTEIGNHCQMAKVNNKIASLDYNLKNGDIVEILSSEKSEPKRDWLNFVHTNLAKDKIKDWLRKQNKDKNLKVGRVLLNQELLKIKKKSLKLTIGYKSRLNKALELLNYKTFDNLLIGIAQGDIAASQFIKKFYSKEEILPPANKFKKFIFFENKENDKKAIIENEEGLLTNIAKCCNPELNDTIVAHITRNKGASIHKEGCKETLKKDKGRVIKAKWTKNNRDERVIKLRMITLDRIGLISDISSLVSSYQISIESIKSSKLSNDTINLIMDITIKDIEQLSSIIESLQKVKGALEVRRI